LDDAGHERDRPHHQCNRSPHEREGGKCPYAKQKNSNDDPNRPLRSTHIAGHDITSKTDPRDDTLYSAPLQCEQRARRIDPKRSDYQLLKDYWNGGWFGDEEKGVNT
jgi:hypothetical protein